MPTLKRFRLQRSNIENLSQDKKDKIDDLVLKFLKRKDVRSLRTLRQMSQRSEFSEYITKSLNRENAKKSEMMAVFQISEENLEDYIESLFEAKARFKKVRTVKLAPGMILSMDSKGKHKGRESLYRIDKVEKTENGMVLSLFNQDHDSRYGDKKEVTVPFGKQHYVLLNPDKAHLKEDDGPANVSGNIGTGKDIEATSFRYPKVMRKKKYGNVEYYSFEEWDKPDQEDLEEENSSSFAGLEVFKVSDSVFENFKNGKNRYHKWNRYLDEDDDECSKMYEYAKNNPGKNFVVQNKTGAMYYVRSKNGG